MAGKINIKKVAFGNQEEAFIESRFKDSVNLIFSKSNNKGKTLLIQGLMYSLGNEPIFPSGFDYKQYYFYSQINIDNIDYHFLRKGNSIIIKSPEFIQICSSIAEFKHFINKNVFGIPSIFKDEKKRIVEPYLLYEMFFLGQDNRVPSNIINKGQYNKVDFISMISAMANVEVNEIPEVDIKEESQKLSQLHQDLKNLKRKLTIVKNNKPVADYTQKSFDKDVFEKKRLELDVLNKSILELKKSRYREYNRKVKLEALLHELSSLNQKLSQGKINCGECGSDKIIFNNDEFNFEISNMDVRSRIMNSINENIEIKEESIKEYDLQIEQEQIIFNKQLELTSPELGEYILFKDEIIESSSVDIEISKKQLAIDRVTTIISLTENNKLIKNDSNKKLIESIVTEMNLIYKTISPSGNQIFVDLFAKKDQTFSGSEGQEFYFSKLVSLSRILNHKFPIINDSFRSGEVSSDKERMMLDIYEKLGKQVILTSTLKEEEYAVEKYTSTKTINAIDYNINGDSKILSANFSLQFQEILSSFELNIK